VRPDRKLENTIEEKTVASRQQNGLGSELAAPLVSKAKALGTGIRRFAPLRD
jgi:hypothetical protein